MPLARQRGRQRVWEGLGVARAPRCGFTDPREAALAACFGKQSNPAVSQGALYKPDFGEIILRKQESRTAKRKAGTPKTILHHSKRDTQVPKLGVFEIRKAVVTYPLT